MSVLLLTELSLLQSPMPPLNIEHTRIFKLSVAAVKSLSVHHHSVVDLKSSYFYENLHEQTKMAILSRKLILLALLLFEQLIHLTWINLRPKIQFLSTQQRAYQSFLVTSWFDSVCVTVTRWVNFREKRLHKYEL